MPPPAIVTAPTVTAPAAPIARENVISPSKMKQRSRTRPRASPRASPKATPKARASPKEGRDDDDTAPSPRPPPARRKSSGGSSSSGSKTSSAARVPPSPRSSATQAQGTPTATRRKSDKENKAKRSNRTPTNTEARSAAAAAAAALRPDSKENAHKALMSNLRAPDPSLADLLAVLTDFEGTSHLRRVNACGAIKTLTLHKANQIPLARTRGVVPSLTSVLCAVHATEEERTRCINALMHLCVPEANWKLVYLFPQTPEALARNMADKYPQIRYAACLAASFLAKKNRTEVVANRLLMYAMARVVEVDKHGALERTGGQDRKVFVGARLCVLKMLLHLSKNRDVSTALARTDCVTGSLVGVAGQMEPGANVLCMAILTNLTRHPENAHHLVHKAPGVVATLVSQIESNDDECAKCALYALQNLSCTGNCRQELANAPDLLAHVTKAAFRRERPEQQLGALHVLKNLSDDPFNLVTMTNTPGCTATLLALANNDAGRGDMEKGGTSAMAQYLACDTLATLSHWLLTLSATRKGGRREGGAGDGERRTFRQCTWEAWN